MTDTNINKKEVEERHIQAKGGMGVLFLLLFLMAVSIAAVVFGIIFLAEESFVLGGILLGVGILFSVGVFIGAETERGAGFNPVRSILWHLNRPGLFLCKPVCYGGESGSAACGSFTIQLRSGNSGFAGGRSGDDIRQKNFVKSHDLEQ